ncbi:MAG: hypothetical protein J6574_01610 [Gilliamella sp.]|nr:hypothetical protein [Gilliamella sp.]
MNISIQEKRNQLKVKENQVIRETCNYLINNGFSIKQQNDEKLNLEKLLTLHDQLFDQNGGNGNGNVDGEEIFLKVIDADNQDGWISFKPSNGFMYVITGHSDNLCKYMYAIQSFMYHIA